MLLDVLGSDKHPLYTRYYSFRLIYDSLKGNQDELKLNYVKNLELHELANGVQSVFNLDALLTEVSVKADILEGSESEESIRATIAKMKAISVSSNYVTQAEVMLALTISANRWSNAIKEGPMTPEKK